MYPSKGAVPQTIAGHGNIAFITRKDLNYHCQVEEEVLFAKKFGSK